MFLIIFYRDERNEIDNIYFFLFLGYVYKQTAQLHFQFAHFDKWIWMTYLQFPDFGELIVDGGRAIRMMINLPKVFVYYWANGEVYIC